MISKHLRVKGRWEPDITEAIWRSLDCYHADKALFLDIGANIGTHSLQIATLR